MRSLAALLCRIGCVVSYRRDESIVQGVLAVRGGVCSAPLPCLSTVTRAHKGKLLERNKKACELFAERAFSHWNTLPGCVNFSCFYGLNVQLNVSKTCRL